ncbi:hypothetical protein AB0I10_05465 [Streptomyces sp. NPDC050636]|uniref:hypothetical protein n=1 Tax=Streptomyces sp. NPDC050636 TaxID=3154510 RepID=UPI00342EE8C8
MFSRKKIAVVSGLVGGLVLTCTGATQVYAAGSSGDCTRSALGNTTCIDEGQTSYTSKDGRHVVKQRQHCSSTARHRVVWPESGLLNRGNTETGPVVDCSNRVPLPKGFKPPQISF